VPRRTQPMTTQSTTRTDKKASETDALEFSRVRKQLQEGDVARINGDPRELRVSSLSSSGGILKSPLRRDI